MRRQAHSTLWTLTALCAASALSSGCLRPTRIARDPLPKEATLTVLTYNVNYGIPGDLATLAGLIAADADLVLLQESNEGWQQAVQGLLSDRYPHQHWHHEPAAGGLAVLSRRPFQVAALMPSPTRWFPAMRIVAETALGPVQVLNLHLHPPVSEDGSWVRGYFSTDGLRRSEVQSFAATLRPELPTLIAGDFNEGTSGAAVRWLEAQGLRTVLPEYAPAAKTWHWPVGSLELRAQLDHIAYDTRLAPLEARVLGTGRSDHFPVRAVFVRAPQPVARPPAPRGGSLSLGLR